MENKRYVTMTISAMAARKAASILFNVAAMDVTDKQQRAGKYAMELLNSGKRLPEIRKAIKLKFNMPKDRNGL